MLFLHLHGIFEHQQKFYVFKPEFHQCYLISFYTIDLFFINIKDIEELTLEHISPESVHIIACCIDLGLFITIKLFQKGISPKLTFFPLSVHFIINVNPLINPPGFYCPFLVFLITETMRFPDKKIKLLIYRTFLPFLSHGALSTRIIPAVCRPVDVNSEAFS